MNRKIGVKGSIKMVRHAIISNGLNNMTLEDRVRLAKNSFHSINTQQDYNRKQIK